MYNAKKSFLVNFVKEEAKPAKTLSNLTKLFNSLSEITHWKDPV